MLIPIIFLMLFLNQSVNSQNKDFTKNIRLAEVILSNPDTLNVMVKDSFLFYSKPLISLENKKILKNRLEFIKENFNDKNLYITSNLFYGPIKTENDSIYGHLMGLSYKNVENNLGLDFSFIELSPNIWRIYSISPFYPNDWPKGYRRE